MLRAPRPYFPIKMFMLGGLLLAACASSPTPTPVPAPTPASVPVTPVVRKPFKIGALAQDDTSPFALAMRDGYLAAAGRRGVEIEVGSAPSGAAQAAVLEGWLAEGDFDGFIVTPAQETNLDDPLAQAAAQGLPVVNVEALIPEDVAADGGLQIAQRIGSKNMASGQLVGDYFVSILPPGAAVAILTGAADALYSIDRSEGFRTAAEAGGLKIAAVQPANGDRGEALIVASNLMQELPEVKAIFAVDDSMGLGAVEAVEAGGLSGQILVASIDGIPEAVAAVREGRLAATVARFPAQMADLAVASMIELLEQRTVAPYGEPPQELITADNAAGY